MNVLSLFDGISCGQVALKRAGIKYDNYYASEIDKPAMSVTMGQFPKTIQLGNVEQIHYTNTGFKVQMNSSSWLEVPNSAHQIYLLMGGSPCQDISNLKKNNSGLDGSKSSLFHHFVRLKKQTEPRYFLLENVVGNKKSIDDISNILGVKPIKINSSLVSAQNRNRYYWTNIPIDENIKDKGIFMEHILDHNVDEKYYLSKGRNKWLMSYGGQRSIDKKYTSLNPAKAQCLTRRAEKSWNCNYITQDGRVRKLTQNELERLQTLPMDYTKNLKYTDAAEAIGNGWTVDVISHIFKGIS